MIAASVTGLLAYLILRSANVVIVYLSFCPGVLRAGWVIRPSPPHLSPDGRRACYNLLAGFLKNPVPFSALGTGFGVVIGIFDKDCAVTRVLHGIGFVLVTACMFIVRVLHHGFISSDD